MTCWAALYTHAVSQPLMLLSAIISARRLIGFRRHYRLRACAPPATFTRYLPPRRQSNVYVPPAELQLRYLHTAPRLTFAIFHEFRTTKHTPQHLMPPAERRRHPPHKASFIVAPRHKYDTTRWPKIIGEFSSISATAQASYYQHHIADMLTKALRLQYRRRAHGARRATPRRA